MTSPETNERDALLRQQAALAKFGELALKSDGLDAVLQEGCRLVGGALGTDLAKIITCEDHGKTLFVRAGVGWKPNVVGKHRITLEDDSADRFALKSGEPVICTNLHEEERYKVADFVLEEGVEAFVNVPIIHGDDRPPFGILEVDSRRPRQFTQTDISFLKTYANVMAAAVERHANTAELKALAEQRGRLLREIQHRLKNNLQSVSSLIRITIGRAVTPEMHATLESLLARVDALRLVHESIYAADKFDRVELSSYLSELVAALLRSGETDATKISLQTDLKPVTASPDIAIPLGLITTEFITNSIKHAFNGEGTVSVQLDRVEPARALLVLSDDGCGFEHCRAVGTGMRLIASLASQLNAEFEWESGAGTRLSLSFSTGDLKGTSLAASL